MVHSLVSIFAPILLAEAIYDEKANEPWVKPGTFYVLLVLFSANVLGFGRLLAPSHRPGASYCLVEASIIGACLWLANRVPGPRPATAETKPGRSHLWLYVASLSGMLATIVVSFTVPALPVPALAKVVVMLTFYLAFLGFLYHNRAFDPGAGPAVEMRRRQRDYLLLDTGISANGVGQGQCRAVCLGWADGRFPGERAEAA